MQPCDGRAACPGCGEADDAAALRPLFVVSGASASGKSAVLGPLARSLAGRCVTFGADWLLGPFIPEHLRAIPARRWIAGIAARVIGHDQSGCCRQT
jgi:hypothetical protein